MDCPAPSSTGPLTRRKSVRARHSPTLCDQADVLVAPGCQRHRCRQCQAHRLVGHRNWPLPEPGGVVENSVVRAVARRCMGKATAMHNGLARPAQRGHGTGQVVHGKRWPCRGLPRCRLAASEHGTQFCTPLPRFTSGMALLLFCSQGETGVELLRRGARTRTLASTNLPWSFRSSPCENARKASRLVVWQNVRCARGCRARAGPARCPRRAQDAEGHGLLRAEERVASVATFAHHTQAVASCGCR